MNVVFWLLAVLVLLVTVEALCHKLWKDMTKAIMYYCAKNNWQLPDYEELLETYEERNT